MGCKLLTGLVSGFADNGVEISRSRRDCERRGSVEEPSKERTADGVVEQLNSID